MVDLLAPASLAERTVQLCAVASEIGHEAALCDALQAWAGKYFDPKEIRRVGHSLVLGALPGARGALPGARGALPEARGALPGVLGALTDPRPTIALAGHLDTVPAHPGDGPPRIDGGRVVGLGASDMKGGLAVMMALAETLDRATLPVNPCFILYEREEGPYAENGLEPLFAELPELGKVDLAICLEPTDGELQVGCMGSLHATLTFHGKSAHSARPWHGDNAVHKAGALLHALHVRERVTVEHGGLAFHEVMSVTSAHGGRARNVVPEQFTLNLNVRFAPGKTIAEAQAEVRALVGSAATVEFTDLSPSGRVCLDNAHVQRFIRVTGATVASKQAWTDVARFGARGVDACNYGPGETAQAHQQGESAPIQGLEQAFAQLSAFLKAAPW